MSAPCAPGEVSDGLIVPVTGLAQNDETPLGWKRPSEFDQRVHPMRVMREVNDEPHAAEFEQVQAAGVLSRGALEVSEPARNRIRIEMQRESECRHPQRIVDVVSRRSTKGDRDLIYGRDDLLLAAMEGDDGFPF